MKVYTYIVFDRDGNYMAKCDTAYTSKTKLEEEIKNDTITLNKILGALGPIIHPLEFDVEEERPVLTPQKPS